MKRTVGMLVLCLAVSAMGQQAEAPSNEEEFDKLMKSVGQTMGAIKKGLDAKSAETVSVEAKKMVGLMEKNQAFWDKRGKEDGIEWAKAVATAAQKLAAAPDLDGYSVAFKEMGGTCGSCHQTYREKLPEGGYRIKPAVAAGA